MHENVIFGSIVTIKTSFYESLSIDLLITVSYRNDGWHIVASLSIQERVYIANVYCTRTCVGDSTFRTH